MKILHAYKIKVGTIVRYIVEENKSRAHARFNLENDLGDWNLPLRYLEQDDMKKAVEYFLPDNKVVVNYRGEKVILQKQGNAYYYTKERYVKNK